MKNLRLIFIMISCINTALSQPTIDTMKQKELSIQSWLPRDINRLPDEENGFLYAGKKSEVIYINNTHTNIAARTGRQIFAKVPGIFVDDMDGSGNQLNISTRGLDPHRSPEFNTRQNGVIIHSDMYGYPASDYRAPLESFEKIELVRSPGSLQYGAQFGGMINFITKRPDTTRPFSHESIHTAGSFGLFSSYHAVAGTIRKFSYSAYYYRRHSGGYRKNTQSDGWAQFIQLQYAFNKKVTVQAAFGRTKYMHYIPGPLNDSMFNADPQASTRSRNYLSPDIYIPSLNLHWKISGKTNLTATASGVFGARSSVQFDAFANVPDIKDPQTDNYKSRQVDIDHFNSRTIEVRVVHRYNIEKVQSRLATGVVYTNNNLHRQQLGKGTTGDDYDLTLLEPEFGRELHSRTSNTALFAENSFQLTRQWSVSPGIRYENGNSAMGGVMQSYAAVDLPNKIKHNFIVAGISTQYLLSTENIIYGGISQAYRPVIFRDIIPASTYERIDKNLKDADGYNIETGIRGKVLKHLQYDISYFRVLYKNRPGTLVFQDNADQPYTYKTNVGNSVTNGIELFVQYKWALASNFFAGLFTSTSYTDARYKTGLVSTGATSKSIAGNKVEAVPAWISRNGFDFLYKRFTGTILYNYTSSTFSDALNTTEPPGSGARGFTPSYSVWDFNASCKINKVFTIKAGMNNIFNKQYFTRRTTFYPGPGIWPGDGRNVYATVSIKI